VIDLVTGQELWQTERERDAGLTTLALSPDGRVLASGSDMKIPHPRLGCRDRPAPPPADGHSSWVCKLVFTRDGRRLISQRAINPFASGIQAPGPKQGPLCAVTHDEFMPLRSSEPAQLVASAVKDGNLMLWKDDGKNAADGYRRLPETLRDVLPLDRSRVMLLSRDKPPELVDLKRDSPPFSLSGLGSSTNVLGLVGTNILCHWDGTNPDVRPGVARSGVHPTRSHRSGRYAPGRVYLQPSAPASGVERRNQLAVRFTWRTSRAPERRIELKSDVRGLVPFRFSEDGKLSGGQGAAHAARLECRNRAHCGVHKRELR